jgi:hypothetical protein
VPFQREIAFAKESQTGAVIEDRPAVCCEEDLVLLSGDCSSDGDGVNVAIAMEVWNLNGWRTNEVRAVAFMTEQ